MAWRDYAQVDHLFVTFVSFVVINESRRSPA